MYILGLSGYARSGKDEVAKVLTEEYGYIRVAFADKLRDMLYALNPTVLHDPAKRRLDFDKPHMYVQDVIEKYGWDGYKESPYGAEIRRLLQRLGTEAGRQTLWDSIWIDAALTGLPEDANVVVTDCRFPNEAQAVKDRGGDVMRISRLGNGPANQHASELSLDDWDFDFQLKNAGTLEDFQEEVRKFHGYLEEELYMRNVVGV
jgi:hypothetical protein